VTEDNCICPDHHHKDKDGYPRVKWQKKMWRLNRLMWYLSFGEIPIGQVVAHTCNNKGCINPKHFYLTTPQQNSTDAAKDGLYVTGKQHPLFKHSVETAAAYQRYLNGESQQKIADDLGISQSSLSARFIRYKQKGLIEE
jgi:hypothetical protein